MHDARKQLCFENLPAGSYELKISSYRPVAWSGEPPCPLEIQFFASNCYFILPRSIYRLGMVVKDIKHPPGRVRFRDTCEYLA